jgi:DNA-binding FrmR family transcriptional regulator
MSHVHEADLRAELERRLLRVEGQVKALRNGLGDELPDNGKPLPCDAVLGQISAIQGALNAVAARIVDDSLVACVMSDEQENREHALGVLREAVRLLAR